MQRESAKGISSVHGGSVLPGGGRVRDQRDRMLVAVDSIWSLAWMARLFTS